MLKGVFYPLTGKNKKRVPAGYELYLGPVCVFAGLRLYHGVRQMVRTAGWEAGPLIGAGRLLYGTTLIETCAAFLKLKFKSKCAWINYPTSTMLKIYRVLQTSAAVNQMELKNAPSQMLLVFFSV